ncbi:AraC family transcriptional regulator [Paenibacillus sp. OVF10]|nr:AraC family transcriptional regulator [Paenibacillus sp. OVF10]
MGYERVISFEEISGLQPTENTLEELEFMTQLTETVEAGRGEEALRTFDKIVGRMTHEQWHPSSALAFLEAVAATLERTRLKRETEGCGLEMVDMQTMHLEAVCEVLRSQIEGLADWFGSLMLSKDFILCQQMIAFMNNHLEDSVSIQEIAEHAGIGSSLASQLFKQEMGDTIHGYFTKLRMERACELLLDTDYRISEIATMVGYQHENSFIRVYRKYKDITPGKYRR